VDLVSPLPILKIARIPQIDAMSREQAIPDPILIPIFIVTPLVFVVERVDMLHSKSILDNLIILSFSGTSAG
jgi:hypothetical protein